MKGTMKKVDGEWVIEYWYERTSSWAVHPNQASLPLHPDDVLQIQKDSMVFDDIDSRIASYPDVNFEIIEGKAKLIPNDK